MATGQSDLGNASTEVTSSQMTLAYVKLIAESDCDDLINPILLMALVMIISCILAGTFDHPPSQLPSFIPLALTDNLPSPSEPLSTFTSFLVTQHV